MSRHQPSAAWLSGYLPDIPTPFDAQGAIDWPAYQQLCERQIDAGVAAVVVCETTGEASTLLPDEHDRLVRTAVAIARGRTRIIAGAGSNCTRQAVDLTRRAAAAGADAVLSVVPYYNRPMQAGIEAHFMEIAHAAELPIILHDNPARTNRELADPTLARLTQSGRFVGLKDGRGDPARIAHLRQVLPAGFRLLSGQDASAFDYVAGGGDGCISMVSNVVPCLCRDLFSHSRRGDWRSAQALQNRLAPLVSAVGAEDVPALKTALAAIGLIDPTVRLPLVQFDRAAAREIARAVVKIEITGLAA